MGWVVQHYGWDYDLAALLIAAIAGTAMFISVWAAPRDGYDVTSAARGFPIETSAPATASSP